MHWFKKLRWALLTKSEKIRKLDSAIETAKQELKDVMNCIEARKICIVKAFKEARDTIPDLKNIEENLAADLKEKLELEIEDLKQARRLILDRIYAMEKLKMEYRERVTNQAINNCGKEIVEKLKKRKEDPNETMMKLKQDLKSQKHVLAS